MIPEKWPEALDRLCEQVAGWGAALIVIDCDKHPRFVPNAKYALLLARDADMRENYKNPRPDRHLALGHHGFLADVDLSTAEELADDPLYVIAMRPLGVGWTAGTTIVAPTGDLLIFDMLRSAALSPFAKPELQRLDVLRPHLARAALLCMKLGLERARVVAETLAVVGLPASVVHESGRVLAMNSFFEALAPRVATGFRERVRVSDKAANALLCQSLERLRCGSPDAVGSIPVPATGDSQPLILHLIPIRREAHDIFTGAMAVIIATPLSAPSAPPVALLAGLFDLSPAEARIAGAILEGKSVDAVALALGLTVTTVRSYLKSVFVKTGVRRQAELVHFGLRAAVPPLA